MPDAATRSAPAPRLTLGYAPATFLERGVWVPFTTPQLAGVRVRPADRGGLEFIMPDPAGARGVYIVPWEGVFALCAPTVHDRVLNARLEALRGVTPASIRRAALDAARGGLAGREAAVAAAATRAAEAHLVSVTNYELLMRLIASADPAPGERGHDIEGRATRVVAAIAAELGLAAEQVAAQLEELARHYAPLGVGAAAGQAPVERERAALDALRHGVAGALQEAPALRSADADLVLASADLTLACVRKTAAEALGWLDDTPALLRRWMACPDEVADRLARPDWLLDGWDRLCLLWIEPNGDRNARFAALADLVPAIPPEAATWVDAPVEAEAGALRARCRFDPRQAWDRRPCALDGTARNERFRAILPGGSL